MRDDKNSKKLTGSALEKALAEKQFEQPAMQLVGMVKASEKQNNISFAPAGCETWTDVPSAMIEEAEHLGHQSCKDHSHPLFRLSLQEPKDPTAKVLMGLLASASQSPRQTPQDAMHAFATSRRRPTGGFPVGRGPRGIGLIPIAQVIQDRAGLDQCNAMCYMEFNGDADCSEFCKCVFWDNRNVYACWAEIFGRASAFER